MTYIIAEAGINHSGSFANCVGMIDAAAAAGCDAVKFQLFKAEKLYPQSAGRIVWKDARRTYDYDIYDSSMQFELPVSCLDGLMEHCAARGVDFLCSVKDIAFEDPVTWDAILT